MDKSVIIALTFDQRDEIHLASSEKIPHCTMIYMTSPSSPEEAQAVSEHVAEVARINQPLYINVTGRGTLGPDEADVLFLDRKNESLQELRYHLLSDPTIRRLRDGVAQYDEWTPHVTLGYPTSPSKVKTFKSYSLMGVALEVWFGEFEGPKYVLNNDLMESLEVQMSGTDRLGALLEHHGVKGMKWGIRKDQSFVGRTKVTSLDDNRGIMTLQPQGQKPLSSEQHGSLGLTIFEASQKAFARDGDVLKNMKNLNRTTKKKYGSYLDMSPAQQETYDKQWRKVLEDAILKHLPEGSHAFAEQEHTGDSWVYIGSSKKVLEKFLKDTASHSEETDDDSVLKVAVIRDDNGFVVDFKMESDLEHHGIKGMKWGIRRSDKELGNETSSSSSENSSSGGSSSGSSSNEPTESSQDRYERLKKAIKKKGAKSLSDQDLQFVNQRTNAIKQATKATERKKSTTEKILRDVGESTAKKVLKDVAENYATKIVTNTLIGKNRGNSLKTILENASGVTDEMRENKKAQKALKDTQSAIAKAVEKTRTESVAKHRSAWPGPSKAQGYGDAGKRKLKRDRKITSSSVERILNIAIGGGK